MRTELKAIEIRNTSFDIKINENDDVLRLDNGSYIKQTTILPVIEKYKPYVIPSMSIGNIWIGWRTVDSKLHWTKALAYTKWMPEMEINK